MGQVLALLQQGSPLPVATISSKHRSEKRSARCGAKEEAKLSQLSYPLHVEVAAACSACAGYVFLGSQHNALMLSVKFLAHPAPSAAEYLMGM